MSATIIDFNYLTSTGDMNRIDREMVSVLTQRAIREHRIGNYQRRQALMLASERLWGSSSSEQLWLDRPRPRVVGIGRSTTIPMGGKPVRVLEFSDGEFIGYY